MSILYKSASGREVTSSSYSGGNEYKRCRRLYKLKRIDGWKEKRRSAAYEMGKTIESAIQFYHENGLKPGECVDEAKRLWIKYKDVPLDYTDQEGDWAGAYNILSEQARLYEVLLPTLPIRNPKFQLNFRKELWPGTELAGLSDQAYVDMLSTLEDGTRVIIDIKDQRAPLSASGDLVSLDPQLRRYAWLSGFRNVAFLWFTKSRPTIRKSDEVTLLDEVATWKPGTVLSVVKTEEKDDAVLLYLATDSTVREMDEVLAEIKGKGSTERKEQVFVQYIASGKISVTRREAVTKCKLQYVQGVIPEEDLPEVGQMVGHELLSIKQSYEQSFWPMDSELRGLCSKCGLCPALGICTKNPGLIEERLVQLAPKAQEDEWLKELESAEAE